MCAHVLSKMAETASIKRERVRIYKYSTSTCGLLRKTFQNKVFWSRHQWPTKMKEELSRNVRVVD
jgi:hypothetical protein